MMTTRCKPRFLLAGACIVGLTATLCGFFGCQAQGVMRFRVAPGGALVIACNESNRAVITETAHLASRAEVRTVAADGEVTLSPMKKGMPGSYPETTLLISRPGFEVFHERYRPDVSPTPAGEARPILLVPVHDYRTEALAVRILETSFEPLDYRCGFSPEQRQEVEEHIAARKDFLHKTYPAETAEVDQRLSRRLFRQRTVENGVLNGSALADGGMALLVDRTDRRALVIIDGQDRVVRDVVLAGPRQTFGLVRDGDSLVVVEDGVLRRFDLAGMPLARVPLAPTPNPHPVTGLAVSKDRFLLGLGCRSLRLYSSDGNLIAQRDLQSMRKLSNLFLAPDGAILVQGELEGDWGHVPIAGMKKSGMPSGILRLADIKAEPEVVLNGVETVGESADGLVAYAKDVYRPGDVEMFEAGIPGFQHQLLMYLSWNGNLTGTRDVSDFSARTITRMGQPLGERLLFFSTGKAYELDDRAASPTSTPPRHD